jgi:hypothetical protein
MFHVTHHENELELSFHLSKYMIRIRQKITSRIIVQVLASKSCPIVRSLMDLNGPIMGTHIVCLKEEILKLADRCFQLTKFVEQQNRTENNSKPVCAR